MPRLPDLNDLGARPVPVSRRQIASNPRAGAVGDAVAGLGQTIGGIGQQMLEREDKLNYAAAKSALLQADVAARKELQDDPDYETWEQRYNERMKGAREQASKLIKSRSDRTLFEADAQLDVTRGAAQLSELAVGRRKNARVALGMETLDAAEDAAINATDDATREAALGNIHSAIQGLVDHGDISAVDGYRERQKRTQSYVTRRIDAMINADDFENATKFFEANRGRIDTDSEGRIEARLTDARNNRETMALADEVVNGFIPTVTAPASIDRMVTITAQSESGNRERDAQGRLVTSPAGAQGRMQVMPSTARNPGHGIRPWDGKTDEDRSRVGRELLAALVRKYDGDAAKAWAAYNWGEARVDSAVAKYGNNWLSHAPQETRDYVRKNVEALGGRQGPRKSDLNDVYAQIDARAEELGWSPEKTEQAKSKAATLVQRNETLLKRQEDDAFEGALAKAEAMGRNFTDVSQLGDAYYRASVTDRARLRGMAEENAKADAPKANGDVVRALHRMQIESPGEFASANLAQYRPFMTEAEFDEVSTAQARVKEQAGQWSPRTAIQNALTWGEKFGGVKIEDDEDRYRVYRYMEGRANEWRAQNKGRAPAESEYQNWFREATAEVNVQRSFLGVDVLAPDTKQRAYDLPSRNYRGLIVRQFRAVNGRDPTEAEIEQWFTRMGEVLK